MTGPEPHIPPGEAPEVRTTYPADVPRPQNGSVIAGFLLALLGLYYPILGIPAVVFSAIGRQRIEDGTSTGKGLSRAGLLISVVDIALLTTCAVLRLLVR
jgi:hypothetical protein